MIHDQNPGHKVRNTRVTEVDPKRRTKRNHARDHRKMVTPHPATMKVWMIRQFDVTMFNQKKKRSKYYNDDIDCEKTKDTFCPFIRRKTV